MGDLFWNKVFGALLAVVLVIMGLQTLSGSLFSMGGEAGHHGDEESHSLNDWAHSRFAYYTEIAETGGAGAVEEEVYDLGLLLASADAASGERAFKAKCSTCHSIEQGGSNGTGPNLYGILGNPRGQHAGFGYSGAMQSVAGETWTWADMDEWLENPSGYIRGTSMAFAGLRRDDERADVLAYLASYSPNAPAMPEPLPAEEEAAAEGEEGEATDASTEAGEGGDAVEAELDASDIEEAPATATGEIETQDVVNDRDSEAEGNESEVELSTDTDAEAGDEE
ncbi:MAG: cytochrome c family protein [Pseudomonadota bacterium]|nr:cytochrome c family protein [Pseudomonadota bacterium]